MKTYNFRQIIIFSSATILATGCATKITQQEHAQKQVTEYNVNENEEDRRFRWDIKTLRDPDADWLTVLGMPWQHSRRISELVKWKFPGGAPKDTSRRYSNRNGYNDESNVINVHCLIKEYIQEKDGDIHLVITDGDKSMIAEVPDPDSIAQNHRAEIQYVRKWLRDTLGTPASFLNGQYDKSRELKDIGHIVIVGVPFFDKPHNQEGVADNGIEIHPVLGISLEDQN